MNRWHGDWMKTLIALLFLLSSPAFAGDYIQFTQPATFRIVEERVTIDILPNDCFPMVELTGEKVVFRAGAVIVTLPPVGFRLVVANRDAIIWEQRAVRRISEDRRIARMTDAQIDGELLRLEGQLDREQRAVAREDAFYRDWVAEETLAALRRR